MAAIRKLTANFIATDVDGELLIVDLDGGELFSLTGTARQVWDAIDGQREIAAVAASMAQHYEGSAEEIARDVEGLIADFEDAALVERFTI